MIEYRWAEGGAEVRLRRKTAERDGAWTRVQVGQSFSLSAAQADEETIGRRIMTEAIPA